MKTFPFRPVSEHYKKLLGKRVQKIPVTIAGDCPNRRGLKGMQTCVFCDEWGAAAYPEQRGRDLYRQIQEKLGFLGDRYRTRAFLIYFQAYTSGFLSVLKLRQHFETALSFPGVEGLVVGTRPDCVPPALISLCKEFQTRTFVSIELGVQSFSNAQLEFLRRGHTAQDAIDCIEKIKAKSTLDLGIHLIFGLPGETHVDVGGAARTVSSLPVDHVKLHNLHVLKGTPLEEMYIVGTFVPVDLQTYAQRTALFLQHLDPRIAIQRLAAVSSHWDQLVAPDWTRHKMKSVQFIIDKMQAANMYQGQYWRDLGGVATA